MSRPKLPRWIINCMVVVALLAAAGITLGQLGYNLASILCGNSALALALSVLIIDNARRKA